MENHHLDKTMTEEKQKDTLTKRVDLYEKAVAERIKSVRERINSGRYLEDGGGRLWLEGFAKGKGLDICCGNIPMENTLGIDNEWFNIKTGGGGLGPLCLQRDGDDLGSFDNEELDFIISNYLEVFSSPLKVLNEWNRILIDGGTLALVMSNADAYTEYLGPFCNRHRSSIFTPITINFYLKKAGFSKITINKVNKHMRVSATKGTK
jgi:SAM-dependent methyltransferase